MTEKVLTEHQELHLFTKIVGTADQSHEKQFSQEALTLAAQASLKRVAKTLTHPIKLDVSLVAKTKRNLTGLKIWFWQQFVVFDSFSCKTPCLGKLPTINSSMAYG